MPYDARLLSGVTVLMAVVEAGSMARAADALGLTSSGVGRAIGRLETRVGVRLLERTTRTMTLTDEGRRFYEEVGPHLDGIEQAAITASGAAGIVRGRLRVNVDPFFSRVVLAAQISKFLDRHPEVRLELIMRDHVGDLVADGFDLALRFGDPPGGSLIARNIWVCAYNPLADLGSQQRSISMNTTRDRNCSGNPAGAATSLKPVAR